MEIKLPGLYECGIIDILSVDLDDLKDMVFESFARFSEETADDMLYCDRLYYIDIVQEKICAESPVETCGDEAVNKKIHDLLDYNIRTDGNPSLDREDVYSLEFMAECFEDGANSSRLHQEYGYKNHHIYDRIQEVLCMIIRYVMEYERKETEPGYGQDD